jgi:hypothetical protein
MLFYLYFLFLILSIPWVLFSYSYLLIYVLTHLFDPAFIRDALFVAGVWVGSGIAVALPFWLWEKVEVMYGKFQKLRKKRSLGKMLSPLLAKKENTLEELDIIVQMISGISHSDLDRLPIREREGWRAKATRTLDKIRAADAIAKPARNVLGVAHFIAMSVSDRSRVY